MLNSDSGRNLTRKYFLGESNGLMIAKKSEFTLKIHITVVNFDYIALPVQLFSVLEYFPPNPVQITAQLVIFMALLLPN